jgi:hypothetical protein
LECTALAALLLLTACNVEESLLDNGTPPLEKGNLSFVLPLGKTGTATYAAGDTLKGSDAEYKLVNLRIYWFTKIKNAPNTGANYILNQRFAWGNGTSNASELDLNPATITASGNKTVATVTVGDNSDSSRFYFIANVNGRDIDSLTSSAELIAAQKQSGKFTAVEFEHLMSDALAEKDGKLAHVRTALPMTLLDDATRSPGGFIFVPNPSDQNVVDDVYLKRRVARFDIINTADYSRFRITNVVIEKSQRKVVLHDTALSASVSFPDNTTVIPADSANGPKSSGEDKNHDGIIDDFEQGKVLESEREHLTESVFYLYPTIVGNAGSGKTEISLEGIYGNADKKLYTLDIPDKNIEANKIYRIRVVPAKESVINLELMVDDWEESVDIPSKPAGNTVDWGTFSAKFKGADYGIKYGMDSMTIAKPYVFEYTSSPTDSVKITIVTRGTNRQPISTNTQHVTAASIDSIAGSPHIQSDLDETVDSSNIESITTLTYGGIYETTHTITLPPTLGHLRTTLKLVDGSNATQYRVITLLSRNYNKSGYRPIQVGNLLWAPMNVGATVLPDVKPNGNPTTADGAAITGVQFQWGRNSMFPPNLPLTSITTQYSDDSIANTTNIFVKKNNWLNPANTGLWSATPKRRQGPCPNGWYVPDKDEADALFAATTKQWSPTGASYWWVFTVNATQEKMYFPTCGRRNIDGTFDGYGESIGSGKYNGRTCYLWLANVYDESQPYRLYMPDSQQYSVGYNPSDVPGRGFNVRAVSSIIP